MATAAPIAAAGTGTQPPPLASASLYVGDLDPNVTEPQLFEVFSVVGPVASIRVCRDAMTRRSLGYSYVNFHSVVDAERALDTLNYTGIKGKACRIMWKHRDPSIRKSGAGNIFIKNLDKSVDTRTLHDTFSQFGNILSCKVAMDEHANSRGFGFVQFETAEEANEAMSKVNGMLLQDKKLFVGPFIPRSERESTNGERRFTNCYVKNFPESVSDADFEASFKKHGEVTSSKVMRKDDGTSRCFGFVNFKEADHAKSAVEAMNGVKVFGGEKELYVGRAEKESERKDKLKKKYDQIRMERLKNNQLVNLYIKNLDDTIDDERLRNTFTNFGTITSAKVMRDKDRPEVSKGFGFVCFSSPEEATRAVTAMNGNMVGSKPIYVALHQPIEIRRQMQAAQGQGRAPMLPRFQVASGVGGMPMPMAQMPGFAGQRPGPGQQVFMFPQQHNMHAQYGPRGAGPGNFNRGGQYPPQGKHAAGGKQGGFNNNQQGRTNQNQGQRPQPQGTQARAPKGAGGPVNQQPGARMPQVAPAAPTAVPAPQAINVPPANMTKEQLCEMLVKAQPAQAKQILGERLYALIQVEQGPLAGKITGMLLEGLDNTELVGLIDEPTSLQSKIHEALAALEAHNLQQRA
jgi:polyadenylate-binding protein